MSVHPARTDALASQNLVRIAVTGERTFISLSLVQISSYVPLILYQLCPPLKNCIKMGQSHP